MRERPLAFREFPLRVVAPEESARRGGEGTGGSGAGRAHVRPELLEFANAPITHNPTNPRNRAATMSPPPDDEFVGGRRTVSAPESRYVLFDMSCSPTTPLLTLSMKMATCYSISP